jgi:hypothetical protein
LRCVSVSQLLILAYPKENCASDAGTKRLKKYPICSVFRHLHLFSVQGMVSERTILIYHTAAFPMVSDCSIDDMTEVPNKTAINHLGRRAYYHQLIAAARQVGSDFLHSSNFFYAKPQILVIVLPTQTCPICEIDNLILVPNLAESLLGKSPSYSRLHPYKWQTQKVSIIEVEYSSTDRYMDKVSEKKHTDLQSAWYRGVCRSAAPSCHGE